MRGKQTSKQRKSRLKPPGWDEVAFSLLGLGTLELNLDESKRLRIPVPIQERFLAGEPATMACSLKGQPLHVFLKAHYLDYVDYVKSVFPEFRGADLPFFQRRCRDLVTDSSRRWNLCSRLGDFANVVVLTSQAAIIEIWNSAEWEKYEQQPCVGSDAGSDIKIN